MSLMFGNTEVEIEGNHAVKELLMDEYSLLKSDKSKNTQVRFNFQTGRLKPEEDSLTVDDLEMGKLYLKGNTIRIIRDSGSSFISKLEHFIGSTFWDISLNEHPYDSNKLEVEVFCDPNAIPEPFWRKAMHSALKKVNWSYSSRIEMTTENITYNVIEPILHVYMLKNSQTFLHSSGVVSDSEDAILFTGWGGVGKSSACVQLVNHGDWKYLADDVIIINANGEAYCYPKKVLLYGYNTEGNSNLEEKLLKNDLINRLSWNLRKKILGGAKVRRRISPALLFGRDKIGTKGKISKVFYLLRSNSGKSSAQEITSEEIAERSVSVIAYILKEFCEVVNAIHAVNPKNPSLEEVLEKNKLIYERAFKNSECYLYYVPHNATPPKVIEGIERYIK